jgi:hypothetical protein
MDFGHYVEKDGYYKGNRKIKVHGIPASGRCGS